MAFSFVDLLFLVSLFLPPAVVVAGALLLAMPASRRRESLHVKHAHAH
jgi:hypothetical protein